MKWIFNSIREVLIYWKSLQPPAAPAILKSTRNTQFHSGVRKDGKG